MTYEQCVLRLLWIMDRAPYYMEHDARFIRGTATGVLTWKLQGRTIKRRWLKDTFQNIISLFTYDVMLETYGNSITVPPDNRNDKYILSVEWNDLPVTSYMGFDKLRTLRHWAKTHSGWMEWKREQ